MATIAVSLKKAHLIQLEDEANVSAYCDNVIQTIGKVLNLNLTKKYYIKGDLRKLRGKTAKSR